MDAMESKEAVKKRRASSTFDLVLRFSAFLLTLAAAIVVGLNKETKIVPVKLFNNLPPVNLPVTAKWHYQSAIIYHMVANVIACAYALVSLIVSIATKGGKKGLMLMIIVLDLLMVALLFSGNGSAIAVGLLGFAGNSHLQWEKVCNAFEKYCYQGTVSVALSLLGSLAFLLLVTFSVLGAHKIHNYDG